MNALICLSGVTTSRDGSGYTYYVAAPWVPNLIHTTRHQGLPLCAVEVLYRARFDLQPL